MVGGAGIQRPSVACCYAKRDPYYASETQHHQAEC